MSNHHRNTNPHPNPGFVSGCWFGMGLKSTPHNSGMRFFRSFCLKTYPKIYFFIWKNFVDFINSRLNRSNCSCRRQRWSPWLIDVWTPLSDRESAQLKWKIQRFDWKTIKFFPGTGITGVRREISRNSQSRILALSSTGATQLVWHYCQ